jgi:hypothetical protein
MHLWKVSVLQQDYTVLYPRRFSSWKLVGKYMSQM